MADVKVKRYRVKEVFGPTLQGEGTYAGAPVMFVRLSGCNKWSGRPEDKPSSICNYCDTDFYGGTRMTARQIVDELRSLNDARVEIVVISGGEPTIQLDENLVDELKLAGYSVHLETNGSNDMPEELFGKLDHITMSPKQPLAETKLSFCDDLKLLYPPIHPDITPEAFEHFPHFTMYLQPVMRDDGSYSPNVKATVDKVIEMGCYLSLQTHKILGVQ